MTDIRKKYSRRCPYCEEEIDPVLIQSISRNIEYGIDNNIWIMGCPEFFLKMRQTDMSA